MGHWTVIIGIFMLGAAAGALLNWIVYESRFREIKSLIDLVDTQAKRALEGRSASNE